jgi:hypothetical protein
MKKTILVAIIISFLCTVVIMALSGSLFVRLAEGEDYPLPGVITISFLSPKENIGYPLVEPVSLDFIVYNTYRSFSADVSYLFTLDKLTANEKPTILVSSIWGDVKSTNVSLIDQVVLPYPYSLPLSHPQNYTVYVVGGKATLDGLSEGLHHLTIYYGATYNCTHAYQALCTAYFTVGAQAPAQTPDLTSSPSPTPSLSPTFSSTSMASPTPTLDPTPAPTSSTTPLPTLNPTPSSTPRIKPDPLIHPTPSPTPNTTAIPTQSPTPSPTPNYNVSPSPSSSPTLQPTVEPTQSASLMLDYIQADNFASMIIIVSLAAVIVTVGAPVYFKKRKKKR